MKDWVVHLVLSRPDFRMPWYRSLWQHLRRRGNLCFFFLGDRADLTHKKHRPGFRMAQSCLVKVAALSHLRTLQS